MFGDLRTFLRNEQLESAVGRNSKNELGYFCCLLAAKLNANVRLSRHTSGQVRRKIDVGNAS